MPRTAAATDIAGRFEATGANLWQTNLDLCLGTSSTIDVINDELRQHTSPQGLPPDSCEMDQGSLQEALKVMKELLNTENPSDRERRNILEKRLYQSPTKSHVLPRGSHESPYFSSPASTEKKKRLQGGIVSCIPFPPLHSERFGLLQEKLAHDPLRLLIGVTFLIRTHGKDAIPVFYKLMERFKTTEELAAANKEDIVELTRHLGLQSTRADTYIRYAKQWIQSPPIRGRRHRVENYPNKGDHVGIKKGEVLDDDDPRIAAWEIGHMTKGRYAIDSWRIFCRDICRGLANGWNGEGSDSDFQPEWMRVLPQDKELRAYIRWMWLKEGYEFDPSTGEKEVASKDLIEAANTGRVVWDDMGGMRILDEGVKSVDLDPAAEQTEK